MLSQEFGILHNFPCHFSKKREEIKTIKYVYSGVNLLFLLLKSECKTENIFYKLTNLIKYAKVQIYSGTELSAFFN